MNIRKFVFISLCGLLGFLNSKAESGKLDSLKSALKSERNDSAKVHILIQMAMSLENNGSENEETYSRQALELSKKNNYNKGIAIASDRLGVMERNRSNYKQALAFHNQALQHITPYGICREKAIILNNIGVVYRRLDELSKAAEYHLRALTIAEEIADNKSISVSTNSLGNIFFSQNNFNEALNYFQKALDQEEKSKTSWVLL
ncbi:MAG: tetratricopeptide repeat protein [Bacteroidales bacterium]|nr:tetratricopeptide repeat protein [Bacteroidales bacterium]